MDDFVHNQLRKDLIIRSIQNSDGSMGYIIRDPISRQSFEFDEREFFLCQAFDGTTELSQIATKFQERFRICVSENNLKRFARELVGYGLLEVGGLSNTIESAQPLNDVVSNFEVKERNKSNFNYGIIVWSAPSPERLLISIASWLRPFRFLTWSIAPLMLLAFGILIQHGELFWQDVTNELQFVPKLFLSLPTLIINNFMSRGLQGIVAAYSGARIRYLKVFLFFWIIPRLLINRDTIWTLPRQGRLWSFATSILVRSSILAIGVFIWYHNRTFATNLATWAQTLILVNCIGLLVEINPFWINYISTGLGWLVTYFSVDVSLLRQSYKLWRFVLRRQPFPQSLRTKDILFLLSYGSVTVLVSLFVVLGIFAISAIILEDRLQGTGVVIFFIFVLLFIKRNMSTSNPERNSQRNHNSTVVPIETETNNTTNSETLDLSVTQRASRFFTRHRRSLLFSLGGIIVLLFPYPYSVGGSIQILPRRSQEIQTDLAGKVVEVPVRGETGEWLEAGTVIAVLESVDLENDLLTNEQEIEGQEALLKQREAELARLLATPRTEEVQVTEAALSEAQEQLEAAKRRQQIEEEQLQVSLQKLATAQQEVEAVWLRLETAKTDARFRKQEEKRLEELYEGGAIALQQYEEAQRLAALAQGKVREVEKEIDIAQGQLKQSRQEAQVQRQEVREQEQNVQSSLRVVEQRQADLNLILSGPYPEQINAARQEIKQAEATVKRLQQEVIFLSEEMERQKLRMPFDGFLTTLNLDDKIGQYLEQGSTFAIAEDDSELIGVVEIPEIQIDELSETGSVEIRLLAYPNRKFKGQVRTIEPTAKTDQMFGQTAINEAGDKTQYIPDRGGQVVSVLIEIKDEQQLLIPGMSGYAKIRGNTMPVIVAFSRPLVRFFQLEIWSWLP